MVSRFIYDDVADRRHVCFDQNFMAGEKNPRHIVFTVIPQSG